MSFFKRLLAYFCLGIKKKKEDKEKSEFYYKYKKELKEYVVKNNVNIIGLDSKHIHNNKNNIKYFKKFYSFKLDDTYVDINGIPLKGKLNDKYDMYLSTEESNTDKWIYRGNKENLNSTVTKFKLVIAFCFSDRNEGYSYIYEGVDNTLTLIDNPKSFTMKEDEIKKLNN